MTGEAFEYAIKKDVRNNPIMREVDRERHREMWRSVGVGVFLVAALVFFVWRQSELLSHTRRLGDLQADVVAQQKRNEQLGLELESLRRLDRIDGLARRTLGMIEPGPDDHDVIERVLANPAPAKSALARR
jgi:cell division protein FtsL